MAQSRSVPDRFVALFADGSRAKGPAMPSWPLLGASTRLEGRELFDAGNPVRLIRDQTADVEWEAPLIMLANGDVVNGSPVGLVEAAGDSRLKVQLETPLMPVSGTHVLVRPDRVRRIVGTANANRVEPPEGTVLLTDGRKLVARSIRWREYGLAILTEAGVVEASYENVADAVFPGVDLTSAVLEDNLFASGDGIGERDETYSTSSSKRREVETPKENILSAMMASVQRMSILRQDKNAGNSYINGR